MPMGLTIQIRGDILAAMRDESAKNPEQECCGVLAGRDGIISVIFSARNAHPESAKAYEIAPEELCRMMREMRARDLQMLGIYHSHPRGENRPSPRDIESVFYSDAAYFIVSPLADAPQSVRAFSIRDGHVAELRIETV
ncbi:MAG TPA: M67 family metallopeptidase [Candidatus Acidoferrales bacterium]|nr:M67 family metallopeptidase [Candidatus Acidoferrales bacterium]